MNDDNGVYIGSGDKGISVTAYAITEPDSVSVYGFQPPPGTPWPPLTPNTPTFKFTTELTREELKAMIAEVLEEQGFDGDDGENVKETINALKELLKGALKDEKIDADVFARVMSLLVDLAMEL